jgi:cullin-associated NEDD8-dissociated protein 1
VHVQANVRSTVVTAVKFTITDKPHAIDRLLRPLLEQFLSHIQDPDLVCGGRVAKK